MPYAHSDGARIFYHVEGKGEPSLVFIHGAAANHSVWRQHVERFSKERRVVALDLRGHGQSDKAEDYPQEMFYQDLQAVIKAAGVERPVPVGWSIGGAIGIRYCALNPDKAAGLVLVDHNVGLLRRPDFPVGPEPEYIQGILRDVAEDYQGKGVRSFVDAWFPETDPEAMAIRESLYEMCIKTSPEVILKIRGRGTTEDRREWLQRVKTPTLILQGGASFLGGEAMGRYLNEHIKSSHLHLFQGKGHALFLTAPQEFQEVLASFLEGIS